MYWLGINVTRVKNPTFNDLFSCRYGFKESAVQNSFQVFRKGLLNLVEDSFKPISSVLNVPIRCFRNESCIAGARCSGIRYVLVFNTNIGDRPARPCTRTLPLCRLPVLGKSPH